MQNKNINFNSVNLQVCGGSPYIICTTSFVGLNVRYKWINPVPRYKNVNISHLESRKTENSDMPMKRRTILP